MADTSNFRQGSKEYNMKDTFARRELDKKITNPPTATIGQVLTVTEVDENGVPIAWEASTPKGGYPVMVDNITIEEDGVREIVLGIDLTSCVEARFYVSMPANNLGKTIYYYVSSAGAPSAYNQGWLSSYTNVATGTTVLYRALSKTLGEFSFVTGLQGADIDKVNIAGGSAPLTGVKAPRLVSETTKLVWSDANTSFPIGTRVQTYAWR